MPLFFFLPASRRVYFPVNLNPLRRSWAEIDFSLFPKNVATLRNHMGNAQMAVMAVVKADGYGHGIVEVARALYGHVEWFGVANVVEALRIRDAVSADCKILVLSPLTPDEWDIAVANQISCSVSSIAEVEHYQDAAKRFETRCNLHAVADTGMGRMGIAPDQWPELIAAILASENCELEGVCTHFPNADEDPDFTRQQIQTFHHLTASHSSKHEIHLANSAGIIDFSRDIENATLVRAGLSLYGVSPQCENSIDLQPVLTWKSRVTLVRDIAAGTSISYGSTYRAPKQMTVATIAVGYGDGYPRQLSGSGIEVLIGGRRCPLLGRVTMDQIVVDVSHLPEVRHGAEVVLMGAQGEEFLSAFELASKAGTIPWEIFTGLTNRVERVSV